MSTSVSMALAPYTTPRLERAWAMPKQDVTRIQAVNTLLVEEFGGLDVIDPFHMPTHYVPLPSGVIYHSDYALDILQSQPASSAEAVLFRPPTTFRQAERYIKSHGMTWDGRSSWWAVMKDEIARITMVGGVVISVGWDSNGLGKNRDFQMRRILMVSHGGHWRDTIVTVERKVCTDSDCTRPAVPQTVPQPVEWFSTPSDPIF